MPINIGFLLGALIAIPIERITPRAGPHRARSLLSPREKPYRRDEDHDEGEQPRTYMLQSKHPTYRTINGREYVLVSHATTQMIGMTNDSLEVAADIASKWFKSGDDGLADAIRSLKQD